MSDRTCVKCKTMFTFPRDLKRHFTRKTPCDLIIINYEVLDQEKKYKCSHCNRNYSSASSLTRHINHNCAIKCKISNNDVLQKQIDDLEIRVTELTKIVNASKIIVHTVKPIQHNIVVGFYDQLNISIELVNTTFNENSRLMEYCCMSDEEQINLDIATSYILEALMELVRKYHEEPINRNVYLSLNRSDQVMVCFHSDTQKWEVRSLIEIIRLLFDRIIDNLHKIIVTNKERMKLVFNIQNAISWISNIYKNDSDKFVKESKISMTAHLINMRPYIL